MAGIRTGTASLQSIRLLLCAPFLLAPQMSGCSKHQSPSRQATQEKPAPKAPAKAAPPIIPPYQAPAPLTPLTKLPPSAEQIAQKLKLSDQQKAKLKAQRLVVTPSGLRFGKVPSRIYDEIYQQDLPVFITSDSILYAFHRRYLEFLPALETEQLTPLLKKTLHAARNRLAQAVKSGEWDSKRSQLAGELDMYLSVALRLLGATQDPILPTTSKKQLQEIISKIYQHQPASLQLFGTTDPRFDYSQFKPRGHYTKTDKLERYFRTIKWLGRARVVLQKTENHQVEINHRGFEQAAALSWLIQESGEHGAYQAIVQVLDSLVGPADDDTVAGMLEFMSKNKASGISDFQKISIAQKQSWLDENKNTRSRILGHQQFNNTMTPNSPKTRSFALLGERFTLDSEVLQNLVYDRLVDPRTPKRALLRKLPNTLDIAAALGNPRAKLHLQPEFHRFPYAAALEQQRIKISELPEQYWTKNVHSAWLAAIASLNPNAKDSRLAPVFRSAAWQDKTLSTQLASWAELRHDHILYAKQSETMSIGCEFPSAYVEPVPAFYEKMKLLVSKFHAIVDTIESQGLSVPKPVHEQLVHFSSVLDQLYTIADKELKHQPLTTKEQHFLKQAVEADAKGYGRQRWDGWYPKLTGIKPNVGFYPTIADVHTDPPDQANGYQARILHAGTGAFELATIIVDCENNTKCAFVGPVSSFYEFVGQTRWDDERWLDALHANPEGGRPNWTKSFRDH